MQEGAKKRSPSCYLNLVFTVQVGLSLPDCNKRIYTISQVNASILLAELGLLSRKEICLDQAQAQFSASLERPNIHTNCFEVLIEFSHFHSVLNSNS
jgi:hypothetical protein